jgi:hypothetical protein
MNSNSNSNDNDSVVMERAARVIQGWWIDLCGWWDEKEEYARSGAVAQDGCRYDCVKCKRNYKNKYFGRNTRLCHDCEWAEHERRKGE